MKTLDYPFRERNFKCSQCVHTDDCLDEDFEGDCEFIYHDCSVCPFTICSKCEDFDLYQEEK